MMAYQNLYIEDDVIDEEKEYRGIIRSLQYLTLSPPDIQYVVNKLSRYMAAPTRLHWTAMKKVLRYSGTQDCGIYIKKVPNFVVSGFCNADWGSDAQDRKSQTSFLIHLGGTLVAWGS